MTAADDILRVLDTFASKLRDRNRPEQYVSRQAYEDYLAHNPYNESRTVFPIESGDWQDTDSYEFVSQRARDVRVRARSIAVPGPAEFERQVIVLAEPPCLQTFELSRYLAAVAREDVLATPAEHRISVLPEMKQLLQLEEWNHPDVVSERERPSGSETFQQLARVLETGDVTLYQPALPPNTHWRNWPDGGTL